MGQDPVFCEVCGNEIEDTPTHCPYCGSKRDPMQHKRAGEQWRVVNLEKGMPPVLDALRRLKSELEMARAANLRALVLIHGYGSSGEGGAIKEAVRRELLLRQDQDKLAGVFSGEDFGRHAGVAKQLVKRFPFLKQYVQRSNPGITVVLW